MRRIDARSAIRGPALLLPALLAWIVLLGELNRSLDRSVPASAVVTATAVVGTSYSGPRLKLDGEIFRSRPVDPKAFPPGSDVLIRYRRAGPGGDWTFESVRSTKGRTWSPDRIDIPGRLERKSRVAAPEAVPLLPDDFAISRSTLERIRSKAQVTIALRKGSLGNSWVESAMETGDALGYVRALFDVPGGPIGVGSVEPRLDPRGMNVGPAEGWVGPLRGAVFGGGSALPGRPIDAVRLADGRLAVAVLAGNGYRADGFDLLRLSTDPSRKVESVHFDGVLFALEDDGSVWTSRREVAPYVRPGGPLIHREGSGVRVAEVPVDPSMTALALHDGVVAGQIGESLVRYRIESGGSGGSSRLIETDRWTVPGLQGGALVLDAATIVVSGRGGILRLKSGDATPKVVLPSVSEHPSLVAHSDADGNLVITSDQPTYRPGSESWREGPRPDPQPFWFAAKGEGAVPLASAPASAESFFAPDGQNSFTRGRRVLVRGAKLFVAGGDRILVFDLNTKNLETRVAERVSGPPRRLL
jgi:hypothetical protein